MSQRVKQKKKPRNYALNKKSFDAVLESYRGAKDRGVAATGLSDGGVAAKNPAKPSLIEFRCDVDKAVSAILKDADLELWFRATYVLFEPSDDLEMELWADRMMPNRHRYEQRIGAEFVRRAIYPLNKYFHAVRRPRE